jgi:hypothetical protein
LNKKDSIFRKRINQKDSTNNLIDKNDHIDKEKSRAVQNNDNTYFNGTAYIE